MNSHTSPTSAETDSKPHISPLIYMKLATVPLIWGTHFAIIKIVYEDYSVAGMLALRYILMILTLWIVMLCSEGFVAIKRRDWLYLLLFSLLMVTVYQYIFALGMRMATIAESALLVSTAPIFTALTAALLGWERITRQLIIGVALGFLGIVAVISGGQSCLSVPPTHITGCFIMLGAAILWAWYAVLARPLLQKYSPLAVTTWCHTIGGLFLIPFGLNNALHVTPQVLADLSNPVTMSHAAWVIGGILWYALLSGAWSFTIWYRAVHILGSARTMLFQFLVPIVGMVAGIVLRHEIPSAGQWVGAALTLTGVLFAVRHPAKPVIKQEQKEGS